MHFPWGENGTRDIVRQKLGNITYLPCWHSHPKQFSPSPPQKKKKSENKKIFVGSRSKKYFLESRKMFKKNAIGANPRRASPKDICLKRNL